MNDITGHLAPPITCVFLLGIFWPAASARSATWTLRLGSALGVMVFALKTLYNWLPAAFAWIPSFFTKTPFMVMTVFLFLACLVLQVLLTIALPKLQSEDPERLYWSHPLDALRSKGWPGLANYRVLAAIVFAAFVGLYVVFG